MSPAVRFDLHVHSRYSPDGRSTVAEIAQRLGPRQLAGFALTDHNSIAGHTDLAEWATKHPEVLLVPGVEVSTREGHLLLYGVRELPPRDRPLADVLDWATAHAAEAVLAHPFRRPHGAGRRLPLPAGLRTIETLNGHSSRRANARAERLATDAGLSRVGGSDAHAAHELGRARTVLGESPSSVDDLLEALRRGRTAPEGESLSSARWVAWGLRAGLARLRRGLRPV